MSSMHALRLWARSETRSICRTSATLQHRALAAAGSTLARRVLRPSHAHWLSTGAGGGEKLYLKCAVGFIPHPEKAHKGGEVRTCSAPHPHCPWRRARGSASVPPSHDCWRFTQLAPRALTQPGGGQDALFVLSPKEYPGGCHSACGVADGVGGWADQGVDPAEYSRALMSHAGEHLTQQHEASGGSARPDLLAALSGAYGKCTMLGSRSASLPHAAAPAAAWTCQAPRPARRRATAESIAMSAGSGGACARQP